MTQKHFIRAVSNGGPSGIEYDSVSSFTGRLATDPCRLNPSSSLPLLFTNLYDKNHIQASRNQKNLKLLFVKRVILSAGLV
jgi:hypothetical protein